MKKCFLLRDNPSNFTWKSLKSKTFAVESAEHQKKSGASGNLFGKNSVFINRSPV